MSAKIQRSSEELVTHEPTTSLKETLDLEKIHFIKLRSSRRRPLLVKEISRSIDDITTYVTETDSNAGIYPRVTPSNNIEVWNQLQGRLKEMRNKKFAYIAQSLSVCANVDVPIHVEGRMFDVFLSEVHKPAIIFSVLKNDSSDSTGSKAYVSSLVKKIVSMVRQFTNEHFSAVFGLLYDSDLASEIQFRESILKLTHATAKHCIPESLSMFPEKHVMIVKAFLSGIALTTSVLSDTDEASGMTSYLNMLTQDQFRILSENVDRQLVHLTTYPGTGSKTLLIEITKRLGRVGRCVLISDDQEFITRARKHNVTLDAYTLKEIKQMGKEQLLDVKSVVTTYDLDVILSVMDQPSRMWISKKIIDHPVVHSPLDAVSPSRTASEGVSNEIPTDGSSVQGATAKIRISVPAENGGTIVHVECANNKMMNCSYEHRNGQELPLRSKWTFKNVPNGLMELIMDDCDDFFNLIDELKKLYHCNFSKTHNKSYMVVEFLHDTEVNRNRMVQDKDKVKKMFQEFLHDIKKDAPNCSLEVSREAAPPDVSDTTSVIEVDMDDLSDDMFYQSSTHLTKDVNNVDLCVEETSSWTSYSVSDSETSAMSSSRSSHEESTLKPPVLEKKGVIKTDSSPAAADEGISIPDLTGECSGCAHLKMRFRKTRIGTPKNCFLLHTECDDLRRKSRLSSQETNFIVMVVSALRNSCGGVLVVHLAGVSQDDMCINHLDKAIGQDLSRLLENGELYTDIYERKWLCQTRQFEDMKDFVLIEVQKTENVCTVDFNTKMTNDVENLPISLLNMKSLLRKKERATHTQTVQRKLPDNVQDLQMNRHIQTKSLRIEGKLQDIQGDVNKMTEYIWSHLRLKDSITALSKVVGGGSYYLGIGKAMMRTKEGYLTYIPTYKGFKLHVPEKLLAEHIYKKLESNICVLGDDGTFTDGPEDLIRITFHKLPVQGAELVVLEVAIRYCHGVVFYDKQGPKTYVIEDAGCVRRMDRYEWLQRSRVMDSHV